MVELAVSLMNNSDVKTVCGMRQLAHIPKTEVTISNRLERELKDLARELPKELFVVRISRLKKGVLMSVLTPGATMPLECLTSESVGLDIKILRAWRRPGL